MFMHVPHLYAHTHERIYVCSSIYLASMFVWLQAEIGGAVFVENGSFLGLVNSTFENSNA